ncbi:hypothetical protein L9F63_016490 [Diploptera punctata]|uniref:C-type lectin domain-containing protein n=1 Tax=Diploptera punctata TaxID=6984 RepID=A0AAD8EHU4_DIPPU|nr:hypothetical protein L9F63_016490 [Diploptera punctata]
MLSQGLVCVMLASLCGAALLPVEEGEIQLTASDADTGNWTAYMGEMEVNIEHEHNTNSKTNGTWTLTMARTFYDKEDESQEDTKDKTTEDKTNVSPQTTEATSTSIGDIEEIKPIEENSYGDDSIASSDLANSIPVDEAPIKENNAPDSYSPDYPNFIPHQVYPLPDMYRILPPPPPPPSMGFLPPPLPPFFGRYAPFSVGHLTQRVEDDSDSDEVVTDPDNYEYFKGVGWFKLDNRRMSWEEAKDACLAVGAHLAVPDTQDRVRVFLKLFQRHPEIPRSAILRAQVYVGVNDPLKNRVFTTVQGNIFNPDFPIWFTSEPDNAPPGEDCVTFHMEGRTRDVPCFYELPFFCEKDLPVVV